MRDYSRQPGLQKQAHETGIARDTSAGESKPQSRWLQPDVAQRQTQQSVARASLPSYFEDLSAAGLQKLSVFNSRRTNRLARATAEAAIDVTLKGW